MERLKLIAEWFVIGLKVSAVVIGIILLVALLFWLDKVRFIF